MLGAAVLQVVVPLAHAQNLNELFSKVNPSVVVIRAKGRDVSNVGVTRFSETGSGVLVTGGWQGDDGRARRERHGRDHGGGGGGRAGHLPGSSPPSPAPTSRFSSSSGCPRR